MYTTPMVLTTAATTLTCHCRYRAKYYFTAPEVLTKPENPGTLNLRSYLCGIRLPRQVLLHSPGGTHHCRYHANGT